MTDHIRPDWARYATQSITRAEERDDAERDRDAAERDAALALADDAIAVARAAVAALHHPHGLNLIDVLDYLDAARGAVLSEAE